MNKKEFFSRINNSSKPVIVDLWAPWCAPCRAMQPAFKQVSQKYSDQVFVVKINADESHDVLQALGVRGIPTVIGFAHGHEIMRRTGLQNAQALDLIFDSTLNERKPAVMPLARRDRILRAGAGAALAVAGWLLGQSIILLVLGGVLLSAQSTTGVPFTNQLRRAWLLYFVKPLERHETGSLGIYVVFEDHVLENHGASQRTMKRPNKIL